MYQLRDYQKHAIDFAVNTLIERRGAGLLQGCGLGKTAVTLHTLELLKWLAPESISSVLITAPMRVVDHWADERKVWGTSLPVRLYRGLPKKRAKMLVTPFEGITVVTHGLVHEYLDASKPPDCFVIDEASKFRNWDAGRVGTACKLAERSPYRLLLTGTPCPNSTDEIFAQQYLIDLGKTLGKYITDFRARFMFRGGYENRQWIFDPMKTETLQKLIHPYYLHQESEKFLDLPKVVPIRVPITLPAGVKLQYKSMQDDLVAELASTTLVALSGSDRYRMSRQLASGVTYTSRDPKNRTHEIVHVEKMRTIEDLLPELEGPVLIAYQYKCEQLALMDRFARYSPLCIGGGTSAAATRKVIEAVQNNSVKIVLVQNQAASHGIDGLQKGCHNLIYFTLPDSGDDYEQLIKRLQRPGQTKPVIVHYLQAVGTIDAAMYRMLENKVVNQTELLRGLRELCQ